MGKKLDRLWAETKTGTQGHRAKAFLKLAKKYFSEGENDFSASASSTASGLYRELGNLEKEARARILLASSLSRLNRFEEAYLEFDTVAKLIEDSLDAELISDFHWASAVYRREEDGLEISLQQWLASFESHRHLGYDYAAGFSAQHVALLYSKLGYPERFLEFSAIAVELLEKSKMPIYVAGAKLAFGRVLRDAGEYEAALEFSLDAHSIFKFLENQDGVSEACLEVGLSEKSLGTLEDAKLTFQIAESLKGSPKQIENAAKAQFHRHLVQLQEIPDDEVTMYELANHIAVLKTTGATIEAQLADLIWSKYRANL